MVGGLSGGGGTCDDAAINQEPYEVALARARCEHPDMLVHPRCYTLERVPALGQAHHYRLAMSTPVDRCDLGGTRSTHIASYCVGKGGKALRLEGAGAICRD